MTQSEVARRQRCRALEVAAALGVLLGLFALVGRTWPTVVIGLAGAALLLLVHRRSCADLDRDSES